MQQTPISPSGKVRKPKLFVGLALGPDVQTHFAEIAHRLEDRGLRARYEALEKYHVTLAFLGWVDPSLTDPIRAAMQAVAARSKPFNLQFDRVGAFPDERRPRVVFLGSHNQPQAFRDLAQMLRTSYEAMGFTFKDAAVAHVTLARIKENRRPMPTISDFPAIEVPVGALTLFDSIHEKETTRYEQLVSTPLSG